MWPQARLTQHEIPRRVGTRRRRVRFPHCDATELESRLGCHLAPHREPSLLCATQVSASERKPRTPDPGGHRNFRAALARFFESQSQARGRVCGIGRGCRLALRASSPWEASGRLRDALPRPASYLLAGPGGGPVTRAPTPQPSWRGPRSWRRPAHIAASTSWKAAQETAIEFEGATYGSLPSSRKGPAIFRRLGPTAGDLGVELPKASAAP